MTSEAPNDVKCQKQTRWQRIEVSYFAEFLTKWEVFNQKAFYHLDYKVMQLIFKKYSNWIVSGVQFGPKSYALFQMEQTYSASWIWNHMYNFRQKLHDTNFSHLHYIHFEIAKCNLSYAEFFSLHEYLLIQSWGSS